MNNKIKKQIKCLIIIGVIVFEMIMMPLSVFADFYEKGLSLNIDTTTVKVDDEWQKIKNAAVIHLVAHKMQSCLRNRHVLTGEAKEFRPAETDWVSPVTRLDGVLDKGNVFNSNSTDWSNNIGVGPWMSSIFKNQRGGIISCSDYIGSGGQTLFDMFVYILKNYKKGFTVSEIENPSVSREDRLSVICDGIKPGLLAPATYTGVYGKLELSSGDCREADYYTGRLSGDQENHLRWIYNTMKDNSGNEYIVSWDNLGTYDGVEGYHLYSLDFGKQCGGIGFSPTKESDSDEPGFKVDDSTGMVQFGYYKIDPNNKGEAVHSFVVKNNRKELTCLDLIDRMNEHIGNYIQTVNLKIYNKCKTSMDEVIDEKRKELTDKYLNDSSKSQQDKDDANKVMNEFTRIQGAREYVAKRNENGSSNDNTELVSVAGENKQNMPGDVVLTCRSHLPYINIVMVQEDDLAKAIEDEFKDACYEAVDLAWVVCPVIKAISETADGLMKLVEDFF